MNAKTTKPQKAPELLKAPPWNESMGKVLYHYQGKPAGSRCLWCVRWTVAFEPEPGSRYPSKKTHNISINDWERAGWELQDLSDEAIRCELEDVSARPNEFAPKAVELLLNSYPTKANWRHYAEELLAQTRPGYPESIAPWNPPAEVHGMTLRPGWESFGEKPRPKIIGVRK